MKRFRHYTRRAFTLTEVVIATTILGVMTALFMSVYLDVGQLAFISDSKNLINRDIRSVTQHMSRVAREASYFALYDSFAAEDRDEASDQLLEGKTGDFVVFVFLGLPDDALNIDDRPIVRIVGYLRSVADPDDPAALGPVKTFDLTITGDDREKAVEALLPAASTVDSLETIVGLSQGMAKGDLFFNLWNQSIMLNAKVIHGNKAKWVTDTYNYTVSPRGIQQ